MDNLIRVTMVGFILTILTIGTVGHNITSELKKLQKEFFSIVHENWTIVDHPTILPAYTLWRLCWIHPFVEGNGRTARTACYYLICLKQGRLLPGKKTVPERIRENRVPYYEALHAADVAWEAGQLDVSSLADYLGALLKAQLEDVA
jgi:Fic family protein